MRIAVIDSGVHPAHPHIGGVAGGVGIDDHGRVHDDYVDRLGHGTAVTAVIRERVPDAQIWAVKLFDRQLSATGVALLASLQWARTHGVDLINLSLGTTNVEYEDALAAEVQAARRDGVVVVAAAPQEGARWLPGALSGVVHVMLDMTRPREACDIHENADGEVTMWASGYPRPIPGVSPERNLKGVSFAVANATAYLAQAWPAWPSALLPRSGKLPSVSGR